MEKNIVVRLIIQDMKSHQLLQGLEKLGLSTENGLHTTSLLEIIAQLMGIPEQQLSDGWCETYMGFLGQSTRYEITTHGDNLQPLAEACYGLLVSQTKREKWQAESTFHNLEITATGILNPKSHNLGTALVRFVGYLKEDTEVSADHIDRQKSVDKRRSLAIEESLSLIKQLHLFTEDIMKLTFEELITKYHLK